MRILVTGGTGFIGQHLVNMLLDAGHDITVLSRNPNKVKQLFNHRVSTWASLTAWRPDIYFDAVINLAGEPIIDKAWTPQRKRALEDSRIGITEQLISAMTHARVKPQVLLSGSAIGIYGNTEKTQCTENSQLGTDYAATLCQRWEAAAQPAEALGVRVCCLRTGLVLHHDGGLLKKMILPFKLGLGSRLGHGQQMMSWIHLNDYLNALIFLLHTSTCRGVFNLTAPHPVSNTAFTHALANCLHRKAWLVTPEWMLKPILKDRAILLFGGQCVLPKNLTTHGFQFQLPTLESALQSM
jgi:hypothetical protein